MYVPGDVDQQRKCTVTLMVILMFTFDPYMGVDLVVLNDGMLTGTDALTTTPCLRVCPGGCGPAIRSAKEMNCDT